VIQNVEKKHAKEETEITIENSRHTNILEVEA
jgi:hypothetical protein